MVNQTLSYSSFVVFVMILATAIKLCTGKDFSQSNQSQLQLCSENWTRERSLMKPLECCHLNQNEFQNGQKKEKKSVVVDAEPRNLTRTLHLPPHFIST